jgi:phosphohistidine phosphatase
VRRTLVIMRHAKAVRPEGWADVERPLTGRGRADAAAAGAWLAAGGWAPDIVLCSPSTRTRETWQAVGASFDGVPVRYEDPIYLAGPGDLVDVVRSAPAAAGTTLLIGHNPGVTLLSTILDPDGDIGDGLRTSGIAVHTWDGEWVDCGPRIAALAASHTPRASRS